MGVSDLLVRTSRELALSTSFLAGYATGYSSTRKVAEAGAQRARPQRDPKGIE